MSPDLVLLLILLLGAGSAVVLMAIAATRGRRRPEHLVPWILALVGLGAPALFISAAAVGSSLQVGIVWWLVVGAVGLWALFVLALELCEPLAQEIDHGDRTDAYPRERGRMYVALLAPCVATAIPVAAIITLTMWLTDSHDLGLAAIVSVPAVIGGITGACINIVSGAPDQLNTTQQQNMMPPEVAGTASLVKAIWPVVLSIVGGLPMVAAREAIDKGQGGPAAATRTVVSLSASATALMSSDERASTPTAPVA